MLHIEFLVEDISGKRALDAILPNLAGDFSYRVIAYKGIGRIPKGLKPSSDASKRILLDQLPRLMQGYATSFKDDSDDYVRFVFIVCDLDDRVMVDFLKEINNSINVCHPVPKYKICLAIEEGEAWLLGDQRALLSAYPKANKAILATYVQDSICGTWEKLADVVYPGGAKALKKTNFVEIGRMKSVWADNIAPLVEKNRNISPSFNFFVDAIVETTSNN
ncbi:hypothetical protein [Bosea vaviloviae]|uniref:hypothetical protein n=1 Tax=Bosea vaviloviae TaxID=1526658 RepID=UPI0009F1C43F|nr:hypothetical protein [Bosea vaviloviae]